MNEWFYSFTNPPPRDGSWLIVAHEDFSGLEFIQFYKDEWVTGEGEGNLFEIEDFHLHRPYWTYAPKWMPIYCEERLRRQEREKWLKSVVAPKP